MRCAQLRATRFDRKKATRTTGQRDIEIEIQMDIRTDVNTDAHRACGRYIHIGGRVIFIFLKALRSDLSRIYFGYPDNLSK